MSLSALKNKVSLTKEDIIGIFSAIDKDNNKKIEPKELLEALQSLKSNITMENIESWVKSYDTTKDGQIDIDEFQKGISDLQNLVKA
jgi:hypothetical protein